jgi:hypothetical protein
MRRAHPNESVMAAIRHRVQRHHLIADVAGGAQGICASGQDRRGERRVHTLLFSARLLVAFLSAFAGCIKHKAHKAQADGYASSPRGSARRGTFAQEGEKKRKLESAQESKSQENEMDGCFQMFP